MDAQRPLYAGDGFLSVVGETLRPGGLKLTREGLALLFKAGLPAGARVLDVGCATGASMRLCGALGLEPFGVDWHPGPRTDAGEAEAPLSFEEESKPPLSFVAGDMHVLPFKDGAFAGLLCECVLSLASDLPKALGQACRVLSRGGLLLATDLVLRPLPKAPPLAGPMLERGASCLAGAMEPSGWRTALESAGFELLLMQDRSRELAELLAQLVWHDAIDEIPFLLPKGEGGCSCARPFELRRRYGYALMLARKRG